MLHSLASLSHTPLLVTVLPLSTSGKYQLAQLIQYVPLSCIGAYLGFVGYFCTASGAALAMGIEVSELATQMQARGLHLQALTCDDWSAKLPFNVIACPRFYLDFSAHVQSAAYEDAEYGDCS